MKTKIAALLLLSLGLAQSALAVPYVLQSADATKVIDETTNSTFYQVTGALVESGTAAGLYETTITGSAGAGWSVNISFGANPQPFLTGAFYKASTGYLSWDAADLVDFNAGTFTSIVLMNSNTAAGLRNPPGNSALGLGHAGLLGRAGEVVVDQQNHNVPDASSTVALLGLGMIGLFVAARRRASK